jgi:threonine/homoserine/homoserine lactone efflux protein
MTIGTLLAFAAAFFVACIIPGPCMLAITARSVSSGFGSAMVMSLGVAMGDMVYLLLAAFGLSHLAASLGGVFLVVKYAGAAYLVWLGVKAWLGRGDMITVGPEAAPCRRSVGGGVLGGFVICMGNPKVILFYCSFLPAFVDVAHLSNGDVARIAGTCLVVLAACASAYALAAARAIKLLRSRRALRLANRTAGTLFIGCGIAVAAE